MTTITKEFTKEQLQQIIETDHVQCGEASALARIALASLEAEPVAEVYQPPNVGICAALGVSVRMLKTLRAGDKLFTAPPAPVSVPDEVCWEDVPEEITEDDMALASAWAHGFNQCRAAMLKHSEPFIVTSDHRMMEMPQVEAINAVTAMLQGVENVKSRCTIQTAPALDSLTKNAESRCGNSPVIQDGWVACSERLPENKPGSYEYLVFEGLNNRVQHDYWNVPDAGDDCQFTPFWNHYGRYVTHWMPLPAAPQQEVDNG